MEQQTFEGSWEDILQYAPELAGQRVRLTVLSPTLEKAQKPITLDKTLQGRVGRVEFTPADLSARTKDAFAEILDEKYQSWNRQE